MKVLLSAALGLLLLGPAVAQNGKVDVAAFSPRGFGDVHNWHRLGESESSTYWSAHWPDSSGQGTGIILKIGQKSIGDGYSTVSTVAGYADCSGAARGAYPVALNMVSFETVSAITGQWQGSDHAPEVALARGTALANAVKYSCDEVARNH